MSDGIRHREQKRALWAYETVRKLARESGSSKEELKSHIRKLPSHIQASGLAQTLLFYGQKQQKLADELARHLGLGADRVSDSVKKLISSSREVRLRTREALDAAQWLKRFAEVEL